MLLFSKKEEKNKNSIGKKKTKKNIIGNKNNALVANKKQYLLTFNTEPSTKWGQHNLCNQQYLHN